jgi:hypothetical protein
LAWGAAGACTATDATTSPSELLRDSRFKTAYFTALGPKTKDKWLSTLANSGLVSVATHPPLPKESTMKTWKPKFALLLMLLLGLTLAAPAIAKLVSANLGLTPGGTTCDGPKGTYMYTATWKTSPTSRGFQVSTGNQCAIGGSICGISTQSCPVTCTATGACSAALRACVIGKGAQWIQVTATDGTVYQKVAAAAPGKCQ